MKEELRNIFTEPEKERNVPEFLKWYENGVKEIRKKPCSYEEEVLLRKRDSENLPTAKRLAEEISPLYNLLFDSSSGLTNCKITSRWGNQKFDVEVKGHPRYKFIEIVTAGENRETAETRKRMLFCKDVINNVESCGLEVVSPVACEIEKAILDKIKKNYGPGYILLVSYNNEKLLPEPWKKELFRQLEEKNIPQGCFEDIFITGFSMGDPIWKFPKMKEE